MRGGKIVTKKINPNIPPSEDSAMLAFLEGEEALRAKHQEREASKLGILRVGNAGCMVSENSCIGACPQTTLARFLGHQLPTEASQAYFDGGIENESVWDVNIRAAGRDFRCEEEIPVVHTLPCGTKITGRPDMVLGETKEMYQKYDQFFPQLVIELKACQATNSAAKKLLLESPDLKHLIQAATYSMFLNAPAVLVYTSNVSGGIVNYFTKREAGGADATFGKIEFKLGWEDGNLYYMKGDIRYDTVVTQQGILDFYSNIAKMARERSPGLIYEDMVDIYGDLLPYNPRNYSDINSLVSDNQSFDDWEAQVKQACSQEYLIKLRKKKYVVVHPTYEVTTFKYIKVEKEIKTFETLQAARKFVLAKKEAK